MQKPATRSARLVFSQLFKTQYGSLPLRLFPDQSDQDQHHAEREHEP